MKQIAHKNDAFTLTELMVAILLAVIVLLGVASVIADAQKGFNRIYNKVNVGIVPEGYVAELEFDSAVRKAVINRADGEGENSQIENIILSLYNIVFSVLGARLSRLF